MLDGRLEIVVLAVLLVAGLVGTVAYRRRFRRESELAATLESRLAGELPAGRGTHLERSPRVRRIDTRDGDQLVPVVRIDLETADTPGMKLVFDYVADVLEAIHPELDGRDVTRYDLEFSFGPDGLLVEGECRRVTIPAAFADRLLEEETYRAFDLRKDVEQVDERDDEVGTLWKEC
ncbi:hypothetical protein [Natronobacterium texcoconense]|uniref:Uncharacterized protein n=1 Tax=Natronobacterium texcoconense TaxID=1095778 RepID=A0A1H1FPP8_NATTX|nr:hypothetical protein [Natronobacterium texcoconense]SDR02516.1 hypothetical protein SAMN04489842_2044 [Natronobacterium texcoconense]